MRSVTKKLFELDEVLILEQYNFCVLSVEGVLPA